MNRKALLAFVAVVLLSVQSQAGYSIESFANSSRNLGDAEFNYGERPNSPNSDAKSVWHDCSNTTQAGACDDSNSIILGYYDYDDGWNSARFHFSLNGVDAACIGPTTHSGTTPSVRLLMDFQVNGPTNSSSDDGWGSNGYPVGPGSSRSSVTDYSAIFIGAFDFDDDEWKIWDAQTLYKFDSSTSGTIKSTNDGTTFQSDWWDLPLNGTLHSGNSGTFFLDEGYGTNISVAVTNLPEEYPFTNTQNMRTEIKSVDLKWWDEVVSPTNPSTSAEVSSVAGQPEFDLATSGWTSSINFNVATDTGASDACGLDHLEYIIQPRGSSAPSTSATTSTTTNANVSEDLQLPSTTGRYRLWVRAVDVNGNEAAWQYLDLDLDLDLTKPQISSSLSLRALPSSGWYNSAQRPSFQWGAATDAHSGLGVYVPFLNSLQNTTQLPAASTNYTLSPSEASYLGCSSGNHWFSLRAFDKASPVPNNQTKSIAFAYDPCSPTPPSSSFSQWHITNTPLVPFSQGNDSGSGLSSCSLTIDGTTTSVSGTTCAQPGTFSRTLLDGSYTGAMSACDVAGNCATGSDFLIQVDTVAPSLNSGTISGVTPNQWGSTTTANISLNFDDPNPNAVTVSSMDRAYALVRATSLGAPGVPALTNSSHAITSCATTCSLSFDATLTEGNWSVWYLAYDEAGNQLGPLALADNILIDLSGPSATTPAFSSTLTNQSSLSVLWPAATDALSGVNGYRIRLIDVETGSNVSSALIANLSKSFTALSDGVYRACVGAYDNVGNFGQESCSLSTARIDTVDPVLTASSNVSGWTGSSSVRLTWNASDESSSVVVRFLQGSTWSQAFPANHSLVVSNLAEGTHTIEVKANDSAGNVNIVQLSFGVDLSSPTLSVTHAEGSGWTSDDEHQFTWNASDALSGVDSVSIYVDDVLFDYGLEAAGTVNISFDSGQHDVKFIAVDDVGNERTAVRYVNVDLGQPTLTCSLSTNGWTSTLPSANFVVDGNGSISTVIVDVTYDGSPLSHSNGSISLPASLPGNHSLMVTASNQAGTNSSCQMTVQYDPSAPALTAPPSFPSVTSTLSISATSPVQDLHSGLLDLQWTIDGVEYAYTSTSFATNTLDLSMLSEGTHAAQLRVRDVAGNVRWWNHTFMHDITAPSVNEFQLVTSTNNGWLNISTAVFEFDVTDNLDGSPEIQVLVNGAEASHAGGQATAPLQPGSNTVLLRVTDHGGLVSTALRSVHVDAVTPTCTLSSNIDAVTWSNLSTRSLLANVQSGASNITALRSVNGGSAQTVPFSFDLMLDEGASTVMVKVESEAGLSSTCSIVQLVDSIADEVVLTIEAAPFGYGDGVVNLRLTSVAAPVSDLQVELVEDGAVVWTSNVGEMVDEQLVRTFVNGSHTLAVRTVDQAMNSFVGENQTVVVTLDQTAPSLTCHVEEGTTTTELFNHVVNYIPTGSISPSMVCVLGDDTPFNLSSSGAGITVQAHQNGDELDVDVQNDSRFSVDLEKSRWVEHELSVRVVDRWGNINDQTFQVFFVQRERSEDDLVRQYRIEQETLAVPVLLQNGALYWFDGDSTLSNQIDNPVTPKLEWGVTFLPRETGGWYTLSANGIQVLTYPAGTTWLEAPHFDSSKDSLLLIDKYPMVWFKHTDPWALLTSNGIVLQPGGAVSFAFQGGSDAGPLPDGIRTRQVSSCPDGFSYDASVRNGSGACVQASYLGPEFRSNIAGFEQWNENTSRVPRTLEVLEYGSLSSQSTCTEDSNNVSVTGPTTLEFIEPVPVLNLTCADRGGMTKTWVITIDWDLVEGSDPSLNDDSPTSPSEVDSTSVSMQLVVAAGAFGVLLLGGAVLMMRGRSPTVEPELPPSPPKPKLSDLQHMPMAPSKKSFLEALSTPSKGSAESNEPKEEADVE